MNSTAVHSTVLQSLITVGLLVRIPRTLDRLRLQLRRPQIGRVEPVEERGRIAEANLILWVPLQG